MGVTYGGPDSRSGGARVRFGAIGEGWELFRSRWGAWVLAGLVVLAADAAVYAAVRSVLGWKLPAGGGGFRVEVPPPGRLLDVALLSVVEGVLLGGMFRMACLQVRGRRVAAADLFELRGVLPQLVLGSLIYGLGCFAASAFFVLPALVLGGVWMFTIPLIVDGGLPATAALAGSWHALKGQWFKATLFHTATNLVTGLGVCCAGVGLLFTMPLYVLAVSVLYRDFFPEKGQGPAKPAAPDPYF